MDRAAARTFLYGFGRDRFRLASLATTGVEGALRYGGIVEDEPANGVYWARITMRTTFQGQETLRVNGQRRFLTEGLVFVQLFCPTGDPAGTVPLDNIAELLLTDFRQYQGEDIEFTNSTINDNIAAEANWLRANIVSVFQYRQFIN